MTRVASERVPSAFRPSRRVTGEWRRAAQALGVDRNSYVARWRDLWETTVAQVRGVDVGEGDRDVDMELVESYVRHRRLADFHRQFAEREPYHSKPSGIVHAHPGWGMAQREERLAANAAAQLGVFRRDDVPDDEPEEESSEVELAAAAVVDDQLGPEGQPL